MHIIDYKIAFIETEYGIMSLLATAKKPEPKAPMLTIVGSAGTGKTSLAGQFKNALFVKLEDGTSVFESWDEDVKPTVIDLTESKDIQADLKSLIVELGTTEHDFKTVIYDSITALNLLYEAKICKDYQVTTVADAAGGYFKGYAEVASWHQKFIGWCDYLRKSKDMAIIFLAHSEVEKIKNSPDEASEYAVFGIGMYRKSASLYRNFCDGVYYLTKEKFITGAETNKKTGATTKFGRATESGNRVLITSGDGKTGYIDSKDRYGLDPEIAVPQGTNPLLTLIKFFNQA